MVEDKFSVVRVVFEFPPLVGGSVTHIVELAEAINPLLESQTIIAPQLEGGLEFDAGFPVKVIRLPVPRFLSLAGIKSPWLVLLFYSFRVAKKMKTMLQRDISPDLIHVHGPILGGFLVLWNRLLGLQIPLLVMEHGYGGERGVAYRASRTLSRVFLQRFFPPDFVLLLNDGTRIKRIEYGLQKRNVRYTVVLHGIDSGFFAPSARESTDVGFIVLFPHRNISVKRLDLAIEVFRIFLAKDNCSRGQLVLLCQETLELSRIVAASRLTDRVRFAGIQSREGVRDYLHQCSVVIGTSLESNMNRAIQEAMSCEKPVVVFDSGGTSELVRNMENGILVKPGDVEEFADALNVLFHRPELRKELGRSARNLILRERSWQTRMDREIQAYRILRNRLRNGNREIK